MSDPAVEGAPTALTLLRVTRLSGSREQFRQYALLVDRTVVGHLADGQSLSVEVSPGQHQVWVRLEVFFTSRKLLVDVPSAGVTVYCCSGSAERLDLDLMRPRRYIQIGRAEDVSSMQRATVAFGAHSLRTAVGAAVFIAALVATVATHGGFGFALLAAAIAAMVVYVGVLPFRLVRHHKRLNTFSDGRRPPGKSRQRRRRRA